METKALTTDELAKTTRRSFIPNLKNHLYKITPILQMLIKPQSVIVTVDGVMISTGLYPAVLTAIYPNAEMVNIENVARRNDEKSKAIMANFVAWRMTHPNAKQILERISNHQPSKGQPIEWEI